MGKKLTQIKLKDIIVLKSSFNFKKLKKNLTFQLKKLKDGTTRVYLYFGSILIAILIFLGVPNINEIKVSFRENKTPIEKVLDIRNGGDLTPWSPGVRFKGESSRLKNNSNGLDSNNSSASVQNFGTPKLKGFKKAERENYPSHKKGSGLTVNSITISDDDGNTRVVYMDQEKQESILKEARGDNEDSTSVTTLDSDSTSVVVEANAFSPTGYASRPAAAKRLANELNKEEKNSEPSFTGLSTALKANKNNDQKTKTVSFSTSDGESPKLTEKSESHLITKHGAEMGINDPLPANPNQKSTKYDSQKMRTRVNQENREIARNTIQGILLSEDTEIFDNIKIRGTLGKAYYCPINNLVIGVHKQGDLKDQIVKTQPLSNAQLEKLSNLNILD